ncbi:MAG: glycosyltransferase family 1 protein [Bacteroidales bacterium]|nr:glycosyltransferase family 1 protein [Bacteroidales bacterium]
MRRTRIAVNTRLLIKNKLDGIGWFTFETLKRITTQHPEVDFFFLFDREPDPEFIFSNNVTPVVIGPQARHPVLFVLWFEIAVAWKLREIHPDLFLSPDGYLSLSTKTASLAVMHDLNFEHFPADLPWLVRKYYRFFFPRFAKKAMRIATVSEYSRADIVTQYGVAAEKIDVVYNGANELFKPLPDEMIEQTRLKFSEGHPYFLFVGSLHPRKNLARLFLAFDLFSETSAADIRLLVVGERKWWTKPIREAYDGMKFKDKVHFCGRLGIDDLCRVTASALATTYISYFEGFGIPIIESFRSGVPVITSNVTSMPEVAGDAALLIDPYDVNSISDAMQRLATDNELRSKLITKGFGRAELFGWQITADRLWESIQKSMKQQ